MQTKQSRRRLISGLTWKCPKCDYEVESPDQPEPCPDHEYDDMVEVKE